MRQLTGEFEAGKVGSFRGWIASERASTFVAVLCGVLVLGQLVLTWLIRIHLLPEALPSYVPSSVFLVIGTVLGLVLGERAR
jgi:uncharacterized membrane protein